MEAEKELKKLIERLQRSVDDTSGDCPHENNDIEAAIALLRREWFPIETAPLDGSLVAIGFFRANVFETRDGKPQWWWTVGKFVAADPPPLTASAWQSPNGQGFSWPPTHWAPLRVPPLPPIPT